MNHPWHDPNCPLCKEILEMEGLDSASSHVLGLLTVGRLAEAEAAAREFLAKDPEELDGLARLAIALEANGKFAEAIRCYDRMLTIAKSQEAHGEETYTAFREIIADLKESLPADAEVRT